MLQLAQLHMKEKKAAASSKSVHAWKFSMVFSTSMNLRKFVV